MSPDESVDVTPYYSALEFVLYFTFLYIYILNFYFLQSTQTALGLISPNIQRAQLGSVVNGRVMNLDHSLPSTEVDSEWRYIFTAS